MERLDKTGIENMHIPKCAIVMYNTPNYSTPIFQYHKIINGKLTAGQSLTLSTAKNIFKSLKVEAKTYQFKGIIPKYVLSINQSTKLSITWAVRAQKKYLYFKESTAIESGLYPLPKLIFQLSGSQLRVFAVGKKEELTEDSVLFFSPFLNVGKKGAVCMGTASLNYSSFTYIEDIISFVEKQFFSSVFSETHNNAITKGNVISHYKKLLNKNSFNDNILNPSNIKLSQLL